MICLLAHFKTMRLILKFSKKIRFKREESRQAKSMLSIQKNIIFLYKEGCTTEY